MLSGRGIDGELRSKFGELTEKFWKSGSVNEKIRAIYFANGEGEDGSGGKKLGELKSDGVADLLKGSGEQVERFFGVCVGGQRKDGCKEDDKKVSVKLFGSDDLGNAMAWEKLKEQNWGDQTSLVRSGYKYPNLFNRNIWRGNATRTGNGFNPLKISQLLGTGKVRGDMPRVLCPLVPLNRRGNYQRGLGTLCSQPWANGSAAEDVSLSRFLTGTSSTKYFKNEVWKKYFGGHKILALLVLLDLWSTDLMHVNFNNAKTILSSRKDGFMLASLMSGSGAVVSLINDTDNGQVRSVSYRKGGEWTVQLCSADDSCDTRDDGLSVIIGNGRLCVSKLVCIDRHEVKTRYRALKAHWGKVQTNEKAGALWDTIFSSEKGTDHLERLLVALLVACFSDVRNVSLTVQKPSEKGDLIFTHLK